MRAVLAAVLLLAPVATGAKGLATRDLTPLAGAMEKALGDGFVSRSAPERVTLSCLECDGGPVVDVLIGRQDDGTEHRFRTGETTIATLEALCRERSPTCRLTALDVAPAVGWISAYPMGDRAGATAVVLRAGDLLTIRALAADAAKARDNVQRLVKALGGVVIGD